jgi:5-methylcytosine-specific restriction endonuclease McrA
MKVEHIPIADDREAESTLALIEFEGNEPLSGSSPSLSGKVLLLNGNYEPLSICSVQKAIVLLFMEKADLVHAAEGKVVRSARSHMDYPSVIRLSSYIHIPFKKVILSRKNILRRDGHQCQYCGARTGLTVDHIQPRSRGGEDSWENLTTACLRCNNRKGDRTPDEAHMKVKKRPVRPNHVVFLRQYVGKIDKGWEPYLFMH